MFNEAYRPPRGRIHAVDEGGEVWCGAGGYVFIDESWVRVGKFDAGWIDACQLCVREWYRNGKKEPDEGQDRGT